LANIEIIGGVHPRSSPYYFTRVLAPLETYQAKNLGTNFFITSKRTVVQRKIATAIHKSHIARQANE
jgi:hypothetical protein